MGKLLKRVKKGFNKEDIGYLRQCESSAKVRSLLFLFPNCLYEPLLCDILMSIVDMPCDFFQVPYGFYAQICL